MTNTTARIKAKGKHFEIIVDLDEAIKIKRGLGGNVASAMQVDKIFSDSKKGEHAREIDMKDAFGTDDVYEVAEKIIKGGEVLLTQEFRDEARENKIKQVVDFLTRNAVDPQSGRPLTAERVKNALHDAHVNIQDKPVESQISNIIDSLSKIIPIKIQTKKVKVVIPAVHTGKVYGTVNQYKVKEDWKDDGSLEVVVEVPAGLIMDFYDKINSATHGAVVTEEIKE